MKSLFSDLIILLMKSLSYRLIVISKIGFQI